MVNDTGLQTAGDFGSTRRLLIQTHGILMLIAWPFLASTGIFFASYMRRALPNGEWFQVHRALMVTSLLIAAAGFTVIFFSQSPPGLITLGREDVSSCTSYKRYPCKSVWSVSLMGYWHRYEYGYLQSPPPTYI